MLRRMDVFDISLQFRMNLERLRIARCWSLNQLARESEIARGYVSDLSRGTKSPTLKIISKIGVGLGVPPLALLAAQESPLFAAALALLAERAKEGGLLRPID